MLHEMRISTMLSFAKLRQLGFCHFGIVSAGFLIGFNIVSPQFHQLLRRFHPQPYGGPHNIMQKSHKNHAIITFSVNIT